MSGVDERVRERELERERKRDKWVADLFGVEWYPR